MKRINFIRSLFAAPGVIASLPDIGPAERPTKFQLSDPPTIKKVRLKKVNGIYKKVYE